MWEPPAPPEPLSPLVLVALRELATLCNQQKGFMIPPEKNRAVAFLRALHFTAHERFDPRAIEEWAKTEGGWKAKYAQDLRVIVKRVIEGRNFYSASRIIRRDPDVERAAVERWRQQIDGHV